MISLIPQKFTGRHEICAVPFLKSRLTQIIAAAIFCLFYISLSPGLSVAANKTTELVSNGGYAVMKNGTVISSLNADRQYIPASIWKITTALAALDMLGTDYRFTTFFYLDQEMNLYIQGKGDPFLVSEEIAIIFKRLKDLGISRINNIFLDESLFDLQHNRPHGAGITLNPYDAANSALAANFNTVYLSVGSDGTISSAEPQTPTLPIMKKLGNGLPAGSHRINISGSRENSLGHFGELFRSYQEINAIPGSGTVSTAYVPDNLKPLLQYRSSRSLKEIIREMLLYSNNYMANQLFLTIGAQLSGYPATWEKGRKAINYYLESSLGIPPSSFHCEEGSGISKKNRVTPDAMLKILETFKPHANLLPKEKNHFIKSGTLIDVFSYAGYFIFDERKESFVLMLNQPANKRDILLNLLIDRYKSFPNQDEGGTGSIH